MKIPTYCSKCGRLIQGRIIRADDNRKVFCSMKCKERDTQNTSYKSEDKN